jgi:LPXTG-motif cell wall-anchored protein
MSMRRVLAATAIAAGFTFTAGVGTASAQQDPCDISNFVENGEVDLVAYSACVAAQNNTQGGNQGTALPRTGSNAGLYAGFGSGLVALGASAVWGARRQRIRTTA